MPSNNPKVFAPFSRVALFLFLVCAGPPAAANVIEWLPVTAGDLAATASKIDPDAGAEVLYHVKEIDDSSFGNPYIGEYIRIKVFNEKGVHMLDKVDIPYGNDGGDIHSLEARVIKPDGTIIRVGKNAFYDREIVKAGDVRVRVRSFSFPALEPGVIAEYKWAQARAENIFALKFNFMQNMPSRHVVFKVKPLYIGDGWHTEGFFFRCAEQTLQQSKDGYNFVEMRNLPALVEEPWMPPENDVQPWILFYPREGKGPTDRFWNDLGKETAARVDRHARRPGKLVRETSAMLTRNESSTVARLDALNDYCLRQVLNIDFYTPRGGLDEKDRKEKNRTPDDLIKTKLGRSTEIQTLFIALARAAGIDARPVLCADRRDGIFKRNLALPGYLSDPLAAVKIDGAWRFYDPARRLVRPGALRWQNEGATAMIVLPKGVEWVVTPVTPAARSLTKRTATLRLNDEGALLGEIRMEYHGHAEVRERERFLWETSQKIEESVRDALKARLPGAEVSDVSLGDADNMDKPLTLTYSVTVPGYAESTGQRFFLQPGFFEKGRPAPFTADTRAHDVFFNSGWREEDDITIKLPAGFRLEQAASPPDIKAGDWGAYDVSIAFKRSTNTIIYKRDHTFAFTQVSKAGYPALKRLFDAMHARDTHALTLRVGE